MRQHVQVGPLTATLRECWVLADNLRVSAEQPGWTDRPTLHAIVLESVAVEEPHRRQGHLRRLVEAMCGDERFELVIVEAVQNSHLAEALLRWGWECDHGVMDFSTGGAHPSPDGSAPTASSWDSSRPSTMTPSPRTDSVCPPH